MVKPADALKLADERGLRLVEVAAASKPTVWKLMPAEQAVARPRCAWSRVRAAAGQRYP